MDKFLEHDPEKIKKMRKRQAEIEASKWRIYTVEREVAAADALAKKRGPGRPKNLKEPIVLVPPKTKKKGRNGKRTRRAKTNYWHPTII